MTEELYKSSKPRKLTAVKIFHYAEKSWMELHQKGIKDVFDKMGISIIAITDAYFALEL